MVRCMNIPEQLTALALLGILAASGGGLPGHLLADARRIEAINGLVHAIHLARTEAIKQGVDIVLCPSGGGGQCQPDGAWQDGYLVFANRDRDDPPRVGPGDAILQHGDAFRGRITANRAAFVFRPHGRRAVNGTLRVCGEQGPSHARAVIVSYTGRPRTAPVSATDAAAACP